MHYNDKSIVPILSKERGQYFMTERRDIITKLRQTANKAKEALLENRTNQGYFVDSGVFSQEGLLPEAIGLTSLLLLLIAFDSEPQVITNADRNKIGVIADASLKKINTWVTNDGFVASPLLDAEDTAEFFTKKAGCLDAISWVTSAAILARYAERKSGLSLSSDMHNIVFSLIKQGLGQILNSQRADGTWGFMADKRAKKSLYFSYVAGVTLADFFDYVLGEIAMVEGDGMSGDIEEYADEELLAYLDASLGNTAKMATHARDALAQWLLKDCLPLLPQVASCKEMSEDMMNRLGIWKTPMGEHLRSRGVNYYNLYYTYYLVDLMVVTSTDTLYESLADPANSEAFDTLKAYYKDQQLLSNEEQRYYFGKNRQAQAAEFWDTFVEQAIHFSRSQFMAASRTGANFWDTRSSELPIYWEHEDADIDNEVRTALGQRAISLTDPAVVPMALRANALYSYYICEQTDITVDRLFEDICSNTARETRRACVANLWDEIGYNLMVTERSIEALVDYYDYLCKFNLQKTAEDAVDTTENEVPKTNFELSVEAKIAEYLRSADGRKVLAEVCSAEGQSSGAISVTVGDLPGLIAKLEDIQSDLKSINKPLERHSSEEMEQLLYALKETFNCLAERALYEFAASQYDESDADKAMAASEKLSARFKKLLSRVLGDTNRPDADLVELYDKLRLNN